MARISPNKPYALKHCEFCGDVISNIDKHGKRLMKSRYDLRKACYNTDCRAQASGNGKKVYRTRPIPTLDAPIDLFIYGRAING